MHFNFSVVASKKLWKKDADAVMPASFSRCLHASPS